MSPLLSDGREFRDMHPDPSFIWLDRHGNSTRVSNMRTDHLVFTLRMIWNHSAPEDLKLRPYTQYSFSPFYTTDYMRSAVSSMLAELVTRKDMSPGRREDFMRIMENSNILSKRRQDFKQKDDRCLR